MADEDVLQDSFVGAKLAVLTRGGVLTLLRDDKPDIPFPAMWDLPGGGREGDEDPETCALRETLEELGLDLPGNVIGWRREFPSSLGYGTAWFFVAEMPDLDLGAVALGDEGQRWQVMPVEHFVGHDAAVPHLKHRLRVYLERARRLTYRMRFRIPTSALPLTSHATAKATIPRVSNQNVAFQRAAHPSPKTKASPMQAASIIAPQAA